MVDNIDFVTYDIPVPGNYATRQKLTMDASTSRLFVKAIANTRRLGRVVVYIDGDFRGGAVNSCTPRLRSAYVSFLGLTLGRDVTTFCDLAAEYLYGSRRNMSDAENHANRVNVMLQYAF